MSQGRAGVLDAGVKVHKSLLTCAQAKNDLTGVSICRKCIAPKPARTHHCSICNRYGTLPLPGAASGTQGETGALLLCSATSLPCHLHPAGLGGACPLPNKALALALTLALLSSFPGVC